MKISSLLLIFLLFFSQLALGSNIQSETVSKENGIRVSFDSKILQEKRNLWIHLPANYHQSKDSYAVLYLLDGDRHFEHAVAATTLLAEQERIPEIIVVGLPNNPGTRGRDLAREREKFIQFIGTEVFGYINKQYRTSSINTLFGHSMAGYFTSRTLATHPDLFEKYIAASPVLQNGERAVYKAFTELSENKTLLDKAFYFSLAGEAEEGARTTDAFNEFISLLKEKPLKKLHWSYRLMKNQTHMTTPYLTMFEGLTFVFSDYQSPRFTSHADFEKFGGMTKLKQHYKLRGETYNTDQAIPEQTLRDVADVLLEDKRPQQALTLYKDIIKAYPKSAAAYSGLGEVYKSMKKYDESVKAHEKAVELSSSLSPGWQRFLKRRLEQAKKLKS